MAVEDLKKEDSIQDVWIQELEYLKEFALRSIRPKAALKDVINKKTNNINDTELKAKMYIQENYNTALQIYTDGRKD